MCSFFIDDCLVIVNMIIEWGVFSGLFFIDFVLQ